MYAFHDICAEGTVEKSLKETCPYCLISNEITKNSQDPMSIKANIKLIKAEKKTKKSKYGRVLKQKVDKDLEAEENEHLQLVKDLSHC